MAADAAHKDDDNNTLSSSWNASTNWAIASGSIADSVVFESPLSLIDEASSTLCNSPLVLRPPSPDSPSCEITISLAQKHEIHQIYARSTARVYEIYYAPDSQSSNEYLCTVRCGIAVRDDEVLHINTIKEIISGYPQSCAEDHSEQKSKDDAKSNPSEDDWVDVKVPDSRLSDKDKYFPLKPGTSPGGTTQIIEDASQDLYEATAEIDDAYPCTSITIRLLSLQDKGHLYIDEVYIFGEPVDSADSENHAAQAENSTRSSLMAMLVPTLLQFSKASGLSQKLGKETFDSRESGKFLQTKPKADDLIPAETTVQQEGNSSLANYQVKFKGNGASVSPSQDVYTSFPDTKGKPDLSRGGNVEREAEGKPDYSRVERVLDHLVSRVSKIEDLCLRFEENMLKPMSSIEARLQQVEQKLEELAKMSQKSEFQYCSRISATEFSCDDSVTNSFHYDGDENRNCRTIKHESPLTSGNACNLANATMLHPGLKVTAPEFSNGDEEEDNISVVTDSLKNNLKQDMSTSEEDNELRKETYLSIEQPKKGRSIDDALASAFAGFVESTSSHHHICSQTLTVRAPDFPSEEGHCNKDAPSKVTGALLPVSSLEPREMESKEDSISTSNIISLENREIMIQSSSSCSRSEATIEVIGGQCWHHEEVEACNTQDTDIGDTFPEEHSPSRGLHQITDENEILTNDMAAETDTVNDSLEASASSTELTATTEFTTKRPNHDVTSDIDGTYPADHSTSQAFSQITEEIEISSGDLAAETDILNHGIDGAIVRIKSAATTEATTEVPKRDVLLDVLDFPRASSTVDFESPILEVEFMSQKDSNAKASIEALLGDTKEEAFGVREEDGDVPNANKCEDNASSDALNNLITVEAAELTPSASDAHFSVDMDYCKLLDVPTISGDAQDVSTSPDQKPSAESLI